MSPVWGIVAGCINLILMLLFIGIWVWAWLPRHRKSFDALSRIPMQDEEPGSMPTEERS